MPRCPRNVFAPDPEKTLGGEPLMAHYTGKTRDGSPWTPTFVEKIDDEKCLGCGRCYKACSRNVLGFHEVDEEDSARMFMYVDNPGNCIGCAACGVTCPKKAFSFKPLEL
jgi:Nif-specific ferredoxin III